MEDTLKQVYSLPWIGSHYNKAKPWKVRLLLVGELSHSLTSSTSRDSTQKLIQEYINHEWNHKFWTNIGQVVTGKQHSMIDRAEFWQSVSFYNYVQPLTEEVRSNSEMAFFEVLRVLKPGCILVLGERLWKRLPEPFKEGQEVSVPGKTRTTRIYATSENTYALAGRINNPSSGFGSNHWHPWVKALLHMALQIRVAGCTR